MMMSFIDAHREDLGIEPICRELAIAPSSYREHAARLADPARRSARARRDDDMREHIKRVHENSFGLYGSRKVWHQLRREGISVAKCTVERLMRSMVCNDKFGSRVTTNEMAGFHRSKRKR